MIYVYVVLDIRYVKRLILIKKGEKKVVAFKEMILDELCHHLKIADYHLF